MIVHKIHFSVYNHKASQNNLNTARVATTNLLLQLNCKKHNDIVLSITTSLLKLQAIKSCLIRGGGGVRH